MASKHADADRVFVVRLTIHLVVFLRRGGLRTAQVGPIVRVDSG